MKFGPLLFFTFRSLSYYWNNIALRMTIISWSAIDPILHTVWSRVSYYWYGYFFLTFLFIIARNIIQFPKSFLFALNCTFWKCWDSFNTNFTKQTNLLVPLSNLRYSRLNVVQGSKLNWYKCCQSYNQNIPLHTRILKI